MTQKGHLNCECIFHLLQRVKTNPWFLWWSKSKYSLLAYLATICGNWSRSTLKMKKINAEFCYRSGPKNIRPDLDLNCLSFCWHYWIWLWKEPADNTNAKSMLPLNCLTKIVEVDKCFIFTMILLIVLEQ